MKRAYTLAILVPALILWVWAFVAEPYFCLEKRDEVAAVENFPEGFGGLKIAIVSDTHIGRGFHERIRARRIADAVNAQSPDIILFLGDYTNGYFYQTSPSDAVLVDFLSSFKAKYGKFGIYGNHDFLAGIPRIKGILEASGIKILCNSNARVETPSGSFYLAAIADPQTMDYSYSAALKDIPNHSPIIFMMHTPAVLREIPERVRIAISGHTHGGQLRLPYLGNIVPLRGIPREFVGRSAYYGEKLLSINSAGLGLSRIPARFFCPPEFTILRIIPKK